MSVWPVSPSLCPLEAAAVHADPVMDLTLEMIRTAREASQVKALDLLVPMPPLWTGSVQVPGPHGSLRTLLQDGLILSKWKELLFGLNSRWQGITLLDHKNDSGTAPGTGTRVPGTLE